MRQRALGQHLQNRMLCEHQVMSMLSRAATLQDQYPISFGIAPFWQSLFQLMLRSTCRLACIYTYMSSRWDFLLSPLRNISCRLPNHEAALARAYLVMIMLSARICHFSNELTLPSPPNVGQTGKTSSCFLLKSGIPLGSCNGEDERW